MRHDFREGKIRGLDIKIAFHDLEVRSDLTEEVVGFLVGKVTQAQDLADFAWGEEFL